MPQHYPVILIPDIIVKFLEEHPLPQAKTLPPSPIPPDPGSLAPTQLNRELIWLLLIIWIASFAGVLVIQLSIGLADAAFRVMLLILAALGLGEISYYFFSNAQTDIKAEEEFKKRAYQIEQYEIQKQRWIKAIANESQKSPAQLAIRTEKLRSLLKTAIARPIAGDSSAKNGVSEEIFGQELSQYFKVKQGVKFEIPGSDKCYTADFAIQHPPTWIHIDIEVDEPYVGDTGQPHHCLDDDKDKRRNQFFIEGNWLVIRFAEEQVVKAPESCCKVIADTLALLTGDYKYLLQLKDVPDLPAVKQWTSAEARKMAKKQYRQSYLEPILGKFTNQPKKFSRKKTSRKKGKTTKNKRSP